MEGVGMGVGVGEGGMGVCIHDNMVFVKTSLGT